jgi:type IV pilus assembly protein PilB
VDGRVIDLRVSTLPTQFGESVVLRVLDRSSANLDVSALGFPKDVNEYAMDAITRPNGIFIVTGPTGCGKTTTLYAFLRKVNTIDVKVLTAEDPVEYDIEGIMQVAINEAVGMTFGKALRSFLRRTTSSWWGARSGDGADFFPGIADRHLVLAPCCNDAPALTRLVDMGVEPFRFLR